MNFTYTQGGVLPLAQSEQVGLIDCITGISLETEVVHVNVVCAAPWLLASRDSAYPFTITAVPLIANLAPGTYTARIDVIIPPELADTCTPLSIPVSLTVSPDVTPPVVVIVFPTPGLSVGKQIQIRATATDAVGVTRMEAWINGSMEWSQSGASLMFPLNTSRWKKSKGFSLEIRAYDPAGNVGRSSIQVKV